MRTTTTLFILLMINWAMAQQDSIQLRYAATITEADLKRHLSVLASDAYEGREAGMKGQKMAADYLRNSFQEFGIGPLAEQDGVVEGYYQPFDLTVTTPGSMSLVLDGVRHDYLGDLIYFSERLVNDTAFEELVVAGPVVDAQGKAHLNGSSVAGRAVMLLGGIRDAEGSSEQLSFFQELSLKSKRMEAEGASLLLVVTPELDSLKEQMGHYLTNPRMRLAGEEPRGSTGLQTILISEELADAMLRNGRTTLKKARKRTARTPKTIPTRFDVVLEPKIGTLVSENVLGYVPGTERPGELVVVTAHYDHIGVHGDEVYNGADDDGSGTVALLEMAQAFAQAAKDGHGPRRSVLFMPVSAEEKGLLGSRFYTDHPVFPLDSTVADLNIDMIGRFDSSHVGSDPYVYIIGSDRLSTELHEVNEAMNKVYTGLDLDYTFNAEDDPNRFYYRSDHYNFAKHGVPCIFYFSGVHEDYHQVGDEEHKIRYDLLRQRTLLVFHTAWELANRPGRVKVDVGVGEDGP